MAKPKKTKEQFILDSKKVWGDNIYDYSKLDYQGYQKKCTFICIKHGIEFQQTPAQHLHGACGCKQCQKEKLSKSLEQFLEDARKVHGNKYDYSKVEYKGYKEKICIICPKHGEFWQLPTPHTQGEGCPHCERDRRSKTTEQFIKEAREIHGDKYDYSKVKYINRNTPVTIICPIHGEFEQLPSNHLQGKGCLKCANKNVTTKEFIEKARKIHNNKYDYSKVQYKTAKTPVIIICKKHGEFEQLPDVHLRGCGCPKCGTESMAQKQTLTQEEFIKRAKETHGDQYDYSKVNYQGIDTKVEIICPKHGSFWQTPYSHTKQKSGCPKCNHSKLEEDIMKLLEENKINYEYCIRTIPFLNGLELDFYIPELNIGIECQGVQHFKPVDFNGQGLDIATNNYWKQVERDKIKKELCDKNGINLLYYSNLGIEYPYKVYENVNEILKINKNERLE